MNTGKKPGDGLSPRTAGRTVVVITRREPGDDERYVDTVVGRFRDADEALAWIDSFKARVYGESFLRYHILEMDGLRFGPRTVQVVS